MLAHCVLTKAHYINLVLLPRDIILQKEKKLVALNFGHGSNSIRENILSGQTGHPKSHHVQNPFVFCELRFYIRRWFQRANWRNFFFLQKNHQDCYFYKKNFMNGRIFLIDDSIFENVNDPYHLISTFFLLHDM